METGTHLLVGFDGTAESDWALRWAVREAALRRVPLAVCHAWRWPYPVACSEDDFDIIVRRTGEHLLEHGVRRARELDPEVVLRKRLMRGAAHHALFQLSGDAALVIVGSNPPDEMPPGSTAMRLSAKARRPTVVVRPAQVRHRRVVVGFDGSPAGEAALAFAVREAALWGSRLRVVQGCGEPGGAEADDLPPYADWDGLRRLLGERLLQAVAPWREQYPWVPVETALSPEPPRAALFAAARDADLLVVDAARAAGARRGFQPEQR
ncbi:universal stress protein, partial [Spirillospora sp. NPDC049652]